VVIEALRTNAVITINQFVALPGLDNNIWQNKSTESNKNIREAGFFMMQELSDINKLE
jgi:hypothetical protein